MQYTNEIEENERRAKALLKKDAPMEERVKNYAHDGKHFRYRTPDGRWYIARESVIRRAFAISLGLDRKETAHLMCWLEDHPTTFVDDAYGNSSPRNTE